MNTQSDNPYVGPRTFKREESHLFFGREREARNLLSLVVSERLVLFYAQSGGGKSSLINTCLIPDLEDKGFEVLPVGRVSGGLPPGTEVDNIFVYNLLLSLNQKDGVSQPLPDPNITIKDFLRGYGLGDSASSDEALEEEEEYEIWPRALIIDQFEEILITNLEDWQKREDFFIQLSDAMADDDYLWVVLSMREDYATGLDPYAHLLPGKLKARLYMQRMGFDAALEAIREPVRKKRPFAEGVAEKLANNLCQLRTRDREEGQDAFVMGQYIKPVQLQVVCYQLWENLKDHPGPTITDQDLERVSGGKDLAQFVDRALAEFYEEAIKKVAEDVPGRTEFELRNWFENKLITKSQTRALVNQEAQETGGLDNEIVKKLEDMFLLRAESRAGSTWYELVHDRLVDPILQANAAWRLGHPLIRAALQWQDAGKQEENLYRGRELAEALHNPYAKIGVMREFLEAAQKAQQAREEAIRAAEEQKRRERAIRAEEEQKRLELAIRAEEEKKRADAQAIAKRRRGWLMLILVIMFLASIMAASSAVRSKDKARVAQNTAEAGATSAAAAEETAVLDRRTAIAAQTTAVFGQATARAAQADAVADKELADQALEAQNEAERIANAQSLANAALDNLRIDGDPNLSMLYAIKATRLSLSGPSPVIEAHDALNQALQSAPFGRVLHGHSDRASSVAFNQEGTLLAVASRDSTAIVWDSSTGEMQQTLKIFDGAEYGVSNGFPIAFAGDGYLAAVSFADGTSITIWSIDTAKEINTIPTGHSSTIWSIAFSPDSQYMATADRSGALEMWSLASDEQLWRIEAAHNDGISGVVFSPNGLLVATASRDAKVKIWETSSGNKKASLDDHTAWVNQVAFVDNSQVVTASDDGTAKRWDFGKDAVSDLSEPYTQYIHSIAVSQGKGIVQLAMVNDKGRVIILDIGTNMWIYNFRSHSATVWNLALSQDGTRLATVSEDQTAILWDLEDRLHPIKSVSKKSINDLTVSSEGHYLASVQNDDSSIQLLGFTADTDIEPRPITLGFTVTHFTLSADSNRLATIDHSGVPKVWDISSEPAVEVQTLPRAMVKADTTAQQTPEKTDEILSLALNWDGTLLAIEGLETGLKVWDVKASTQEVEEVFALDIPNDNGHALAFSPNNSHLARSNGAFEVNVWDIESGKLLLTLSPKQNVIALTFNNDGSLLATADASHNIQVWHLDTEQRTSITLSSIESINALTFSPDSHQLLAARADGTLRFYNLDINKLLDVACQYTRRNLTWSEWQSHKRELGEEPEDSLVCNSLPLNDSIVEEYVRQGDQGIEEARTLLESVHAENPDKQIAQALQFYAEQWISQVRYDKAIALLEQALALYPELRSTQALNLANDYYQICLSFHESDFTSIAKTSCDQAVALAAETDDVRLNFEICQYNVHGEIEGFDVSPVCDRVIDLATQTNDIMLNFEICQYNVHGEIEGFDVSPVCDRVIDLATQTDDVSRSLDICLRGLKTGLDEFVNPICAYALEHPNLEQSITSNLELCRSVDSGDFETSFSSACQRAIDKVPHIEFGQEIQDKVESTRGDYWVFEGIEGQLVSIAMGGFDTYLELWESDQLRTLKKDDEGGTLATSNSNSLIHFLVPKSGLYIINARGYKGRVGAYHLILTDEVPKPIALGESVSANIADQHFWAFKGEQCQSVSIAMKTTDTDFDPSLNLLDPDGWTLYSNDNSDNTLDARIQDFVLPKEGRYFIRTGRTGTTADYTLTLTETVPQPIEFGESIQANNDDRTLWFFEGKRGQIISIALETNNPAFAPHLTLLGSDCQEPSLNESHDTPNATIQRFILPKEDRYFIKVERTDPATNYTLSLTETVPQSINFGEFEIEDITEVTAWTFAGEVGQVVKIVINETDNSRALALTLLGPNGEKFGERTSSLIFTLPETGAYTILAQGHRDNVGYTLSLREITEELGRLTYGATVNGEIAEATTEYWAFSGNVSEAAKITVESHSLDLKLGLYEPNGTLIGEYDSNDPTREDLSNWLHITGTYIITVRGVDAYQSGPYTLSLTTTDILPVLAWTAYSDVDEEYAHVLDALSRLAPAAYQVMETDTTNEDILQSALRGPAVFLIPEQEEADSKTLTEIGTRFGPVLEAFIRQGGRVLFLGAGENYGGFLQAMGLLDASYVTTVNSDQLDIVNADSPIAYGLPPRIEAQNSTNSYVVNDANITTVIKAESGNAVVVTRSIGLGQVILIGYDYYESNKDTNQLLVNAVFWPR